MLYYHKTNFKRKGPSTDSLDLIKSKKPIDINDKKCFQFTVTEAINDKENPEKIIKIKPSISEYKEYTK